MNGGSKARKKRRRDLERWHRRQMGLDYASGNSYSAAITAMPFSAVNQLINASIESFAAIKQAAMTFAVEMAKMSRSLYESMPLPLILLGTEQLPEGSKPFIEAWRADPCSDTPRLIYGDWLEENGHADLAAMVRPKPLLFEAAAAVDTTKLARIELQPIAAGLHGVLE